MLGTVRLLSLSENIAEGLADRTPISPHVVMTVHAWDYRRYVLSSLPTTFKPARTLQTEIKFTTSKIESNFSNFSAWHQRTKVLEKMWQAAGKEDKGKEFELVTQALWTDPGDQSGWLYHRWLVGDGESIPQRSLTGTILISQICPLALQIFLLKQAPIEIL